MRALFLTLIFATLPFATLAQSTGQEGHNMAQMGADTPAVAAYRAVNDKMHSVMAIPFTGDADVDFIKAMIPHHQGAVEMAQVVLQY